MDNVINRTIYPLNEQRKEADLKRRMGLGITGLGNILTLMEMEYGSSSTVMFLHKLMSTLTHKAYEASSDMAATKGTFPLYDAEKYLEGKFVSRFLINYTVHKLISNTY